MARASRKRAPARAGGTGKEPASASPAGAGPTPRRPGASRRESDRRLVRSYRALAQCNRALVRATSEPELLLQLCRVLVQVGEYQLAWVGYAEDDPARTVRVVAQAGLSDGYLESIRVHWADDALGRGPTGTCIRTGEPAVNRNTSTDPSFEPWRAAALERGYRSSIALPLRVDGRVIGALTVYSVRADAFDPDEQELLLRLSEDLAFGIAALRSRDELRRSEARFRALADESPVGIFEVDLQGRGLYLNRAGATILSGGDPGVDPRRWGDLIHPDDASRVLRAWRAATVAGTSFADEHRLQRPDGRVARVRVQAGPLRDASGAVTSFVGVLIGVP